jgi:hypothetical protein
MKTSEVLIYGAIIYLLYKVYKNTQPENSNKSFSTEMNAVVSLPKFSTVTPVYWDKTQVIPTPAEVLSPEQLKVYNASIKGISQYYTC